MALTVSYNIMTPREYCFQVINLGFPPKGD